MERLRSRTREPGLANPGHAAKLGGLALLQAMVRGEVPDPPITRTLDFYLLEAERGRAVFQGLPQFVHYNPIGTVHGGWHATLLDSAMACAVHTLVEPGAAYTTLEFKIHCVRPLTESTGPVRAEGKVVAAGRRTATAEGRLVDAEGRLYSHGTTTCLFLEAAA
ncbi:MAG: PaaI family thioesterase [Burkholderiales bacterium]|nr:PaaI family thioesterase [Burkholderiales bacterium]